MAKIGWAGFFSIHFHKNLKNLRIATDLLTNIVNQGLQWCVDLLCRSLFGLNHWMLPKLFQAYPSAAPSVHPLDSDLGARSLIPFAPKLYVFLEYLAKSPSIDLDQLLCCSLNGRDLGFPGVDLIPQTIEPFLRDHYRFSLLIERYAVGGLFKQWGDFFLKTFP
ncbi:MAG TPA: hypothetical protein PLY65_01510 [Methanothrix soehngenii]|nr:hypothetical protein [Methanothrix soehngenii]